MISLKKIDNLIYCWFPVLPFLAYWAVAYLAFHFGPFVTPSLQVSSHIYFWLFVFLFAFFYRVGLRYKRFPAVAAVSTDDALALKLLGPACWLTFAGTFLFIYDRLSSGAGSLAVVQNELYSVRSEYAGRVTVLTTLAVIPQSFKLVAFAAYFYCGLRQLKISRSSHAAIFLTIALELINMVLSANRGALYWLVSYGLFYLVFCLRVRLLSEIFSLRNLQWKSLAISVCLVAYFYFVWVAENRVQSSTAEYIGGEAFSLLKDSGAYIIDDYASFGAQYKLYYYLTHGFEYLNAILKHADIINVDFVSALGIRVESQISRFLTDYSHPAKLKILEWGTSEGLSRSGWPSIFGAALAYFGIVGGLIFSCVIGAMSGYSVRRWLMTMQFGWLLICLLVFASMNISFDWIIRDFDQFLALAVGVYLVNRNAKPKRGMMVKWSAEKTQ